MLKVSALILAAFIAGENGVSASSEHFVAPGDKVECKNAEGCVIMSAEDFQKLVQDVYAVGRAKCEKNARTI